MARKKKNEMAGVVDEVHRGTVYATLYANNYPIEIVEIPIKNFPGDPKEVVPGTMFYLGTRHIRLVTWRWTQKMLDDARRKGRKMFDRINRGE
jgi:hypothetical protein